MELTLGPVIAARRMTQEHVAEIAGVNKSFISELVSGKKQPSMDVFLRLCEALSATPNEMFGIGSASARSDDMGFAEPKTMSLAARALERLDQPETSDSNDFKLGTDGNRIQVVATVDRAGLPKLIRRLQAMAAILDD